MLDTLIERINRGPGQRIIAFFILWFAVYGAIWTIFEPLNLTINPSSICLWRFLFIGGTFLISGIIYFSFLFSKKLEVLGMEAGDTNLMSSARKSGNPTLAIRNDGFHGRILDILANYTTEPLDWDIKASANKATRLTIVYKPEPDLMFYARINVLSKNKNTSSQKWLRFEPNMSLPQSINDNEEMGVPVTASDDNGLVRVQINFPRMVITAFGHHGWEYDKVLIIRARGSGKLKTIVLR